MSVRGRELNFGCVVWFSWMFEVCFCFIFMMWIQFKSMSLPGPCFAGYGYIGTSKHAQFDEIIHYIEKLAPICMTSSLP